VRGAQPTIGLKLPTQLLSDRQRSCCNRRCHELRVDVSEKDSTTYDLSKCFSVHRELPCYLLFTYLLTYLLTPSQK